MPADPSLPAIAEVDADPARSDRVEIGRVETDPGRTDPARPDHSDPTDPNPTDPDPTDLGPTDADGPVRDSSPEPGLAEKFGRTATWRHRLAVGWFRLVDRLHLGVISVHLAVGSLIGVEGLAVILGFSAAWPLAIPLVLLGLTGVAVARSRLVGWFRRRR